jgi:DNA-binding NarL/FixJ family response regulator
MTGSSTSSPTAVHGEPPNLTLVDAAAGPPRDAAARRSRPIRVVIAHGQSLARAGLRLLMDGEDDVAIAGEAASGEQVLALARQELPDVVVMDLTLPGVDALESTRRIVADPQLTRVRVLMLTSAETDESILGPLRAGAGGLLVGDSEPAELLRALRLLAAGQAPLSPGLIGALIADVASRPAPRRSSPEELAELTAREREVTALVATGLDNRQIAQQLVISPATAKTHVSRAMRKLHAPDRSQLVVLAYQTGLVVPDGRVPGHRSDGPDGPADRQMPAAVGGLAAHSRTARRRGDLLHATA